MSNHNSKKAWRQWYERCEFVNNLQTETLIPSQNTRDITIMGQGIYVAAIKLSFTAVVGGTATYVPANDVLDQFISNFRIKSAGRLTEQLATSGAVLEHLEMLYLDRTVQNTVPAIANGTSGNVVCEITIPVTMTCPFNITALANTFVDMGYTACTVTSVTMQLNIVTTDVPCPLIFAFASQSINLAATGNTNVTTLTQGFLRESLSIMGVDLVTAGGEMGTVQYVLDDGRGVIYASIIDLNRQFQDKYQTLMAPTVGGSANQPLEGVTCFETSYLSGGQPMPWKGAGRLVLTTIGLTTVPTVVEILVAAPVDQQLAATSKAAPTAQRPRTDLAAGGQTATGPKAKVKY